jgi:hypothetical protein
LILVQRHAAPALFKRQIRFGTAVFVLGAYRKGRRIVQLHRSATPQVHLIGETGGRRGAAFPFDTKTLKRVPFGSFAARNNEKH